MSIIEINLLKDFFYLFALIIKKKLKKDNLFLPLSLKVKKYIIFKVFHLLNIFK